MNIKSKNRNRLSAPGHDFRCAISKVMPRIDHLVKDKQNKNLIQFSCVFFFVILMRSVLCGLMDSVMFCL